MKLSPHFARWEFTVSQTAVRRGIGNMPPPEAWENLEALALRVLEPARVACGPIRVTSGYRSPLLNSAIGGADSSQHTKGEAADIIPYRVPLPVLFRWLYENAPFDQLIWEFGEWIHVSHRRTGPQRGSVLLAHKREGRTAYAKMEHEQVLAMARPIGPEEIV